MSAVTLRGVEKSYGAARVIHGVDLSVEQGEFCVFVGHLVVGSPRCCA
jgi:ABC-type sugar transport system ATPase subunit